MSFLKLAPLGQGPAMTDDDVARLGEAIERIVDQARSFGLDFFEMRYEICPADIVYTFGAYAMPTRFSHWSFGKAFHQMKTQHDFGMSKIYELVINSDPCYAFLLESNSLLQNKMIAAHVLAHSDFFKNNWRFRETNRQMVHSMAAFANRVQQYEHDLGREPVERFLDAVLAIHEHVDPFPSRKPASRDQKRAMSRSPGSGGSASLAPASGSSPNPGEFDDLWVLDRLTAPGDTTAPPDQVQPRKEEPTRDLLLFIMERAPDLADWQRDILSSLRQEMLYFRPQMETKIMNEGWASLWHARIMRALDLTPDEALEFARMHASVLAPSRYHLNPYLLGYHLFEDIERRFGPEKLFEVREIETDLSFIRNYLTRELCEELDLYLFAKRGDEWRISATGWEKVREGILGQIANCGYPCILAEDSDYQRRGELYLRHAYEGVELDSPYLRKSLLHVYHLWQRPVHLETVEGVDRVLYSCTGEKVERRTL